MFATSRDDLRLLGAHDAHGRHRPAAPTPLRQVPLRPEVTLADLAFEHGHLNMVIAIDNFGISSCEQCPVSTIASGHFRATQSLPVAEWTRR